MHDRICETLLIEYAAGTLDPAHALLVASYLTLSPGARRYVAACEAVGGALIEHLCDPEPLSEGCLDAVLRRIDTAAGMDAPACTAHDCVIACTAPLPRPLSALFAAAPRWKRVTRGMEWVSIPLGIPHPWAQILRCAPGFVTPFHTHDGMEITLVLDGALEDDSGRYVRGDLLIMDDQTSHAPVADRVCGCLCLTVTENPMRVAAGFFARILNRLP